MNAPIVEKLGSASITLVSVEHVPTVLALLRSAADWAAQRGSLAWAAEELNHGAFEALALGKELFGCAPARCRN